MSPQEKTEFEQLKATVNALIRVENVPFKASLERRLDFLSGSFQLSDATNVSNATPSSGQVLKWNGTVWAPGTDNS